MPNKGGGGYGGGPYYQGGSGNPSSSNDDIPVVEATPVAEAVPAVAEAQAGGGGYGGTYARPPPVSPYASSIGPTPGASASATYQGRQPDTSGQRPPLPLEPYPGMPVHQGPGAVPMAGAVAQPGMGMGPGAAVMGQPVQPVQVAAGQPMTGEQLVLVQVNPRQPFPCQCPHCGHTVMTELNFVANGFTFLGCLGLALLGCYPCCILPFCMNDCKTACHLCPRCRGVIAIA